MFENLLLYKYCSMSRFRTYLYFSLSENIFVFEETIYTDMLNTIVRNKLRPYDINSHWNISNSEILVLAVTAIQKEAFLFLLKDFSNMLLYIIQKYRSFLKI